MWLSDARVFYVIHREGEESSWSSTARISRHLTRGYFVSSEGGRFCRNLRKRYGGGSVVSDAGVPTHPELVFFSGLRVVESDPTPEILRGCTL